MYLLQLGWPIADADDYHSPANKQKMTDGIPLTDEASIVMMNYFCISQFTRMISKLFFIAYMQFLY